jgi:hypothetical protein
VILFSFKATLREGAVLGSKGESMIVKKGNVNLVFKETTKGGLLSTILQPKLEIAKKLEIALVTTETKEDWMVFHQKLGHPCKELTKKTADHFGIKLTGTWTECQECLMGKAKRKKLKKQSLNRSERSGERFGFDISYLKNSSFGGSKFWLLVVDEATSMVWSYFLRRKSETQKAMLEFIQTMKSQNTDRAKYIRCDNSPENKKLASEVLKKGLDVVFEFTAPGSPEENGKVERTYATMWGRARAVLNTANLSGELRSGLWAECAHYVSQVHNITIKAGKEMCPYEEFMGKKPLIVKNLRIFGEACVRTVRKGLQDKLDNKGEIFFLWVTQLITTMTPSGFLTWKPRKWWNPEMSGG